MLVFLANSPAHVEAGQIADGQGAHRHAEVGECGVDLLDPRAFFQQELGLALVGAEHAVADEAAAVADEHADLAQRAGQGQRSGDHGRAGRFAADDFEQPHDVGGAEEVVADDLLRAGRDGGDLVDVERRRVGGQNGIGPRDAVELGEDLLLELHAFEDGLDDDVGFGKPVVGQRGLDQRQPLVHLGLRELALLDRGGVVLGDGRQAAVEGLLRDLLEERRECRRWHRPS